MNDSAKTGLLAALALVMVFFAFRTTPPPPKPDVFSDQGTPFFESFQPEECTSLEVIDFDEEKAVATPFKVALQNGVWRIPSHHNYPADAKDRLSKTAVSVMKVNRDQFRSNRKDDHEKFGVIDPVDEKASSLTGRGRKVTLRNKSGQVLADLIIGKAVEGKSGYHYVRRPGRKRVYAAKISSLDISSKFSDWIETDLLKLNSWDIKEVVFHNYSINETTGTVDNVDALIIKKNDDDKWEMDDLEADEELDTTNISSMTRALDNLKITGVRPKPASLSRDLKTEKGITLDPMTMLSLQQKGFFVSQDGQLLSNEGELIVTTDEGIEYTLRFGEILYGSGELISAGVGEDKKDEGDQNQDDAATENRYLFVTARFNKAMFPEPEPPVKGEKPEEQAGEQETAEASSEEEVAGKQGKEKTAVGNDDVSEDDEDKDGDEDDPMEKFKREHDDWKKKMEDGEKKAQELRERFADWYYVIPGDGFNDIHLGRDDLVKEKEDKDDDDDKT